MTHAERNLRQEHHVVHDYANLVVTGRMVIDPNINHAMELAYGANGHVGHAFYMNCRKMFEFFMRHPKLPYLRASYFTPPGINYNLAEWTNTVQKYMNAQLLHVGAGRVNNTIPLDGAKNPVYLADFENAWKLFMSSLISQHRDIFRDEIDYRLTDAHFTICGSLGKEFIP
jgi:hypothetical protein